MSCCTINQLSEYEYSCTVACANNTQTMSLQQCVGTPFLLTYLLPQLYEVPAAYHVTHLIDTLATDSCTCALFLTSLCARYSGVQTPQSQRCDLCAGPDLYQYWRTGIRYLVYTPYGWTICYM